MANDTTASASVQPMTAENAANAIEAMMSSDAGEQQDLEAQQDETEDEYVEEESEQSDEESDAEEDAADDETDDEESDEDVDEEQDDKSQRFTVKVDGKEVEVTLDELQQGYSRTQDYTRKTQALAQERKAAQAEFEQVRQERQQYAQLLGALQQQLAQVDEAPVDLNSLYESDPIEWVRQRELQRERQERKQAIQTEQQRLMQIQQAEQQQSMKQYLESQKDALLNVVPQLRDPKVASQEKARWIEAGKSIGFSEQELNGVTDHRFLLALKTIADYNGAVAKRKQVKPVQSASRPTRPGNASNVGQKGSQVKKSQQRLRATGNVRDAASLIEKFL